MKRRPRALVHVCHCLPYLSLSAQVLLQRRTVSEAVPAASVSLNSLSCAERWLRMAGSTRGPGALDVPASPPCGIFYLQQPHRTRTEDMREAKGLRCQVLVQPVHRVSSAHSWLSQPLRQLPKSQLAVSLPRRRVAQRSAAWRRSRRCHLFAWHLNVEEPFATVQLLEITRSRRLL